MSQVNFQLSENLVLNGYAVESAVVSTVPVLKFNGNILATQTFVSDAIAAISIPPAYITSVSGNLSVDGMGVLSLDESGVANDLASGSNFITNSGTQLNINLSSLETQLVTDGFYNSSNLPVNYITSVSGDFIVSGGVSGGELDKSFNICFRSCKWINLYSSFWKYNWCKSINSWNTVNNRRIC